MMRSRARVWTRLLNVISLGVILMGCLFVLLRRGNFEEEEAFAAAPHKLAVADAGADGGAAVPPFAKGTSDTAPPHDADGGASGGEIEPIDLAIAPDGGVPYHPRERAFDRLSRSRIPARRSA